jgi:hypothetical protein
MWNKEKTQELIQEITKKYGSEIAIDGSNAVLGLEEHLDKMVAKLMGVEVEIIKIARHWRAVIERAAITEGIDKVNIFLETERKIDYSQNREESKKEEVEMEIEAETKEANKIEIVDTEMDINNEAKEGTILCEVAKEIIREIEDISEVEKRKISDIKKKCEDEIESIVEWDIESYMDTSLSKSIWAPKKEKCVGKKDIQTKVAAVNIPGDNAEHREKSLRWSLRENTHIKEISEKFTNGNQWCMIKFDCERGFIEAKKKLENPKEDSEKIRLILEDIPNRNKEEGIQKNSIKEKRKEESRDNKEKQAQKELEEIVKQRKIKTSQEELRNKSEEKRTENWNKQVNKREENKGSTYQVTVWDLPKWAKRPQVFDAVRHFGRVEHIEIIREDFGKTKAEISFLANTVDARELEEIWCIPFTRDLLVRVTQGIGNSEQLIARNKYSRKILDLPRNTNEVLLWRQVRRTGAKSLHIFKNTNDNNMRSATVYFANEKDMENSIRFAINYYDNKLRWAREQNRDIRTLYNRNVENRQQSLTKKRSRNPRKLDQEQVQRIDSLRGSQWRIRKMEEGTATKEEFSIGEMLEDKWRMREPTRTEESDEEDLVNNSLRRDQIKAVKSNREKEDRKKEKHKQENSQESLAYVVQLIHGLREKVDNLGYEVPNRS